MGYVGKVTAGGTSHLVGSTLYGTCTTAANAAAKAVTCANFDQLIEGVTIHVKFTNSNTVANPTLNVNSTGAKSIYRYGTTAPSTNAATSWQAGAVVAFTYDGSAWMMNDWLNDNTTYANMTAATASAAGKAGLVPAPAAGAQGKYLRGDGTWQTPTDTNTDTKVNVTLGATTKAYLLGTSTTPTATATGVTAIADTDVYLNTSSGGLNVSTLSASGLYSKTLGVGTSNTVSNAVSNASSGAVGTLNNVYGEGALAVGRQVNAGSSASPVSYCFGCGYAISLQSYQTTLGWYNNTSTAAVGSTGTTSGTCFVIGNGTAYSKSNACRITYAGQVIGKSSYSTSGADYAEFREWADGNPDNEDRRGYFVTLVDNKIQIAAPGDYIEGIISGHPAVIGNFDECWSGQFLKDEWGEYIYEDVEVEDPETGEKTVGKRYKQNPDYDPEMKYIPREERPEWSPVGMLGHLSVRDDGTCKPNGYCKVAEGGIATASDRGYRVVNRIAENIVEIVFSIYAGF